jgi:hypothetical protein
MGFLLLAAELKIVWEGNHYEADSARVESAVLTT